MVFTPKCRNRILSTSFPALKLHVGSADILYVKEFQYLGHVISDDLCDDNDILTEIRNLFTRTKFSLGGLVNALLM